MPMFNYTINGTVDFLIKKILLQYSTFSDGSEGKLDTNDLSSLLYCNKIFFIKKSIYPSLPSENVLYCNYSLDLPKPAVPSLPSENVLYCNLKWHYRLLKNFNLSTNEESMTLIHLYFRYCYQGP